MVSEQDKPKNEEQLTVSDSFLQELDEQIEKGKNIRDLLEVIVVPGLECLELFLNMFATTNNKENLTEEST